MNLPAAERTGYLGPDCAIRHHIRMYSRIAQKSYRREKSGKSYRIALRLVQKFPRFFCDGFGERPVALRFPVYAVDRT
jgi:hypothetical protein